MASDSTTSQFARIDRRIMAPQDRELRLPAYARGLIENLRRTVERLEGERDAARFATNPGESDTLIDVFADPPIGLGRGTMVRFLLNGDPSSRVDVHTDCDGAVLVHGSDPFILRMEASNSLRISVDR